ncbi:MAG: acyl-CoA dehydrogenase family protein [Candidatus Caenarcaniphilales bacterium]|nr:acyl-CoA dehydrogenase family protein [Candidatus Caenarcaniphilales bacterium]
MVVDFELNSDQKELQKLARDFAKKEILPAAEEHDRDSKFPLEIAQKALEVGLMNPGFPEYVGGIDLGILEECIIAEELGAACTGIATALGANMLATAPLIVVDNQEINKKFMAPMMEELQFASYCVTEPAAGSDVAGIQTTAKKVGDEYIINGNKQWITGAKYAKWFFVLAVTDASQGTKGLSAFIVPADLEGVTVNKKEDMMGQRASSTHGVTFKEVKIPAKYLLGAEGEGFKISMKAFDRTRPGVAAGAVGIIKAARDYSMKYATERTAFGMPIAMHEAVSFMIADMSIDHEAAQLMTWKSAWMIDKGERNTKYASFAKGFAADAAMKAATNAVQVYGGYGYSKEYPVEKLMRDAKIYQIYEGTSQIQRLIIAKEIFLRNA